MDCATDSAIVATHGVMEVRRIGLRGAATHRAWFVAVGRAESSEHTRAVGDGRVTARVEVGGPRRLRRPYSLAAERGGATTRMRLDAWIAPRTSQSSQPVV